MRLIINLCLLFTTSIITGWRGGRGGGGWEVGHTPSLHLGTGRSKASRPLLLWGGGAQWRHLVWAPKGWPLAGLCTGGQAIWGLRSASSDSC